MTLCKPFSLLTIAAVAIVMFLGASSPSQAQSSHTSTLAYAETQGYVMSIFAYNTFGPATGTIYVQAGQLWFWGMPSSLQISGDSADITARGYLSDGSLSTLTMHMTGNSLSNHVSFQVLDSNGVPIPDLGMGDTVVTPSEGIIDVY